MKSGTLAGSLGCRCFCVNREKCSLLCKQIKQGLIYVVVGSTHFLFQKKFHLHQLFKVFTRCQPRDAQLFHHKFDFCVRMVK